MAINKIHEFLENLNPVNLSRPDLLEFSFDKQAEKLLPYYPMVVDIARGLEINGEVLPKSIYGAGYDYLSEFGNVAQSIILFKRTNDIDLNVSKRNIIINEVNKLVEGLESSRYGNISIPFYTTYNIIKSFELRNYQPTNITERIDSLSLIVSNAIAPIGDKELQLDDLSIRVEDALDKIIKQSQQKVTQSYAKMFEKQAEKHRMNAIIWLLVAIGGVILLPLFVASEDRWLPIAENATSTIITIESIKRFLIVSFIIYLVGLFFKQYAIQKHLETLNTHRQNTLTSFDLFIQSAGNSEADVRQTLMVEIARAIYDSGQTGYITTKDDSGSTSSIMEITKYLKPDK